MADFTKTISNALSLFGSEQTDNWGSMLWGEKWAFGSEELAVSVGKLLSNSLSFDSTTSVLKDIAFTISNTLTLVGDMGSQILSTGSWSKIWGSSSNAESRPLTSYTSSNIETTYTAVTDITTSWTEQ